MLRVGNEHVKLSGPPNLFPTESSLSFPSVPKSGGNEMKRAKDAVPLADGQPSSFPPWKSPLEGMQLLGSLKSL